MSRSLPNPAPGAKEESGVFTNCDDNAYQGQLNAGFSKVCEIFNLY